MQLLIARPTNQKIKNKGLDENNTLEEEIT
jgi:hypothetical protein